MFERIYLASPYTKRADRSFVYEEVATATRQLILQDYIVFSPIVYGHQMRDIGDTFEFWEALNCSLILWSDVFVVYCIPGWNESDGIAQEERYALDHQKYIVYLDNPYTQEALIKFKRQMENIKLIEHRASQARLH